MVKQTRVFKDILSDHIRSHRKRAKVLASSTLASIEGNKNKKRGQSGSSMTIEVAGLEGVAARLPHRVKGETRDVNLGLSAAAQLQSASHSEMARSAWLQDDLENALGHLLLAEHSLGAAIALSQLVTVQRAIAQDKANMSHHETKSMQAQVISRWRKDVDPMLSAQQAADEMLGRFRWENGTDVAHRTLAKWIAGARRIDSLPK